MLSHTFGDYKPGTGFWLLAPVVGKVLESIADRYAAPAFHFSADDRFAFFLPAGRSYKTIVKTSPKVPNPRPNCLSRVVQVD
jgi:hypothetical protein